MPNHGTTNMWVKKLLDGLTHEERHALSRFITNTTSGEDRKQRLRDTATELAQRAAIKKPDCPFAIAAAIRNGTIRLFS